MKERKPLNPIVQIVLAVLGALILAVAGYMVLIKPEGSKLKRIKASEADAQQTLDAYTHRVAAARSAPKIRIADVYRLAKAMPSKTDMPDVVLELSQLARDSGIGFDSIAPQPEVAVGTFTVLPISVTFNGTFYDLADLLYRLRSLVEVHAGALDATGRLFSVDTLSFGPSTHQGGFPYIEATLVIDAYVYGTAGAPASATSAVTSTTTTTGSTTTTSSTAETTTTAPTTTASASAAGTGAP